MTADIFIKRGIHTGLTWLKGSKPETPRSGFGKDFCRKELHFFSSEKTVQIDQSKHHIYE